MPGLLDRQGLPAPATSRARLSGLIAAEGARPVAVDLPTPAEARELLTARLGRDPVAAEPGAVDRIIDGCGRLPLALAIAAARAATFRRLPLAALAAKLGRRSEPAGVARSRPDGTV